MAVSKRWELHQLDVNDVFLHTDLDEEVHMTLPPSFTCNTPTKVYLLQKSLCGLRQAPHQWFAKLSLKLREYSFIHSYTDYSLFTCRKGDVFMDLLVYIHDIVLASNDSHACCQFKDYLHACFSVRDLGPLKYFLGIEFARNPKGVFLSQNKYALEMVDESGLLGTKHIEFLMEENHKLALATGYSLSDVGHYRYLVGILIYFTIAHPNLCYICCTHTLPVHAGSMGRTHEFCVSCSSIY